MLRVLKAAVDPLVDVGAPVAEVFSDPKPWWAVAAVAPRVDGGDRNVEEVGKVLCREQWFETLHAPIVRPDPVISRSFDAQAVTNPASATVSWGHAGIRR